MGAFEQELKCIEDDLNNGAISTEEYNKKIQELERDYRDTAQQAAEDAYDEEMENW